MYSTTVKTFRPEDLENYLKNLKNDPKKPLHEADENDNIQVSSLTHLGYLLNLDYLKKNIKVLDISTKRIPAAAPGKKGKRDIDTDIKILFKISKKDVTEVNLHSKSYSSYDCPFINKFGLCKEDLLYADHFFIAYKRPTDENEGAYDYAPTARIFIMKDKMNDDSLFIGIFCEFPAKINLNF